MIINFIKQVQIKYHRNKDWGMGIEGGLASTEKLILLYLLKMLKEALLCPYWYFRHWLYLVQRKLSGSVVVEQLTGCGSHGLHTTSECFPCVMLISTGLVSVPKRARLKKLRCPPWFLVTGRANTEHTVLQSHLKG